MKKWLVLLAVGAAFSAEAKKELVTEYIQRYNLPRSITNAVVKASGYGQGIVFTIVKDSYDSRYANYVIKLQDDSVTANFMAFDKYLMPLNVVAGKDQTVNLPTTFERKSYGCGERFVYPYAEWDKSNYYFCNSTNINELSAEGEWDQTKPKGVSNPFVQTYHSDWKYTITYNPNGAAEKAYTSEIINSGALAANEFTRSGYTFKGWAKTKSGAVTYEDEEEITPKDDLSLYAVWEAKKYTATFDANGGNLTGDSSRQVTFGESMGSMPGVYKTRYALDGWYVEDSQGTEKVDAGWVVNRAYNFTITAKWSPATYNLSFKKNLDGETENIPSTTIKSDETYEGKLPTVTNAYYNFTGWYTLANGGDKIDETTKVAVESDQTLYAHWTGKSTVLSFNAMGGSCSPLSKQVTNGKTYGDLPVPTLDGRDFNGWYLHSPTGTQIFADTVVKQAGDSIAYAVWEKARIDVVFDACGGVPAAVTNIYTVDEPYGEFPTVTRTGYTFAGWYTTNDYSVAEQVQATDTVTLTATKLYARWKSSVKTDDVTVTFDPNNGEPVFTRTISCGSSLGSKFPDDPTKTDYLMYGWFTTEDPIEKVTKDTVINADMLVKAKWSLRCINDELNNYDLCFNETNWIWETQASRKYNDGATLKSLSTNINQTTSFSAEVYGSGKLEFAWRILGKTTLRAGAYQGDRLWLSLNNEESWMENLGGVAPNEYKADWSVTNGTCDKVQLNILTWKHRLLINPGENSYGAWISDLRWTPDSTSSIDGWTSKKELEQPPTNAVFTTGGSANWAVTSDPDIITVTGVPDSRSAWVRMVVKGPGTLSFDWKSSSERGYFDQSGKYQLCDHLEFAEGEDGAAKFVADGVMKSFTNMVYACKSKGEHTFIWRYVKDADGKAGEDTAWLQNVKWTEYVEPPVPHTVTFDVGSHGKRTGGGALTQTVEYQASPIAPTISVNAGYEFCGWVDDATGKTNSTVEVEAMAITDDTDFTAAYRVLSYAITYAETKGCANANPTSYTVEDAIVFTALTAPEGCIFKGWSPTKIAKGSTGEKTVTAQWETKKFTVTIDGVSGSVEYGTCITQSVPKVSTEDYTRRTCLGWTGTGDVPATGTGTQVVFTVTQDSSLAWKYATEYWVSVEAGEGGSVELMDAAGAAIDSGLWVSAGTNLTAVATPEEERTFLGWYDAMGTVASTSAELALTVDEPKLLLAKFSQAVRAGVPSVVPAPETTLSGTVTWSAKNLPSGMKIAAKDLTDKTFGALDGGTIYGTPTKPGKYVVKVTAKSGKTTEVFEIEVSVGNYQDDVLPLDDEYGPYGVGVKMMLELGEDFAGAKASGLPAGLKFAAKETKDSTFGVVAAGTVYGIPTKAVTNCVIFTKTTTELVGGKSKKMTHKASAFLQVEAAPTWAIGTFNGQLGDCSGSVTFTAAATGKISGKVITGGKTWSFSASGYEPLEEGTASPIREVADLKFVATAKNGKLTAAVECTVTADGATGTIDGGEELYAADFTLWRNEWKDKGATAKLAEFVGVYTVQLAGEDSGYGYLSLTIDAKGNCKATGKLPDGTSASATLPLVWDYEVEAPMAIWQVSPSAYKGGYVGGTLQWGGTEDAIETIASTVTGDGIAWVSCAPAATGEYGAGFARVMGATGAYYNKLAALVDYYQGELAFVADAPVLDATVKTTDYNESGKKVTTSEAAEIDAADLTCWTALTISLNAKETSFNVDQGKATKPVQDKETKEWSYEGDNDAALTFGFTKATGIFKGSFTCWYDYVSATDNTKDPVKETLTHTSKKVSYEGVMVLNAEDNALRGFYLWERTGSYEDEKTLKTKTFKYKESRPVVFE